MPSMPFPKTKEDKAHKKHLLGHRDERDRRLLAQVFLKTNDWEVARRVFDKVLSLAQENLQMEGSELEEFDGHNPILWNAVASEGGRGTPSQTLYNWSSRAKAIERKAGDATSFPRIDEIAGHTSSVMGVTVTPDELFQLLLNYTAPKRPADYPESQHPSAPTLSEYIDQQISGAPVQDREAVERELGEEYEEGQEKYLAEQEELLEKDVKGFKLKQDPRFTKKRKTFEPESEKTQRLLIDKEGMLGQRTFDDLAEEEDPTPVPAWEPSEGEYLHQNQKERMDEFRRVQKKAMEDSGYPSNSIRHMAVGLRAVGRRDHPGTVNGREFYTVASGYGDTTATKRGIPSKGEIESFVEREGLMYGYYLYMDGYFQVKEKGEWVREWPGPVDRFSIPIWQPVPAEPAPAAEGPVPGKDKVYGPELYVTNLLDDDATFDQIRVIRTGAFDIDYGTLQEAHDNYSELIEAVNNLRDLTDEQLDALDLEYDETRGREALEYAFNSAHQNAMDTAKGYGIPGEDSHVIQVFEVEDLRMMLDQLGIVPGEWTKTKPTLADAPVPAAEEALKQAEMENVIRKMDAIQLRELKKDASEGGMFPDPMLKLIDKALSEWATKQNLTPERMAELEKDAAYVFTSNLGPAKDSTNIPDIIAVLLGSYNHDALKALDPHAAKEHEEKADLARAIARKHALSVQANYMLRNGVEGAPTIRETGTSTKTHSLDNKNPSTNPRARSVPATQNTPEDVAIESILDVPLHGITPESITFKVSQLFNIPIREGFAKEFYKNALGIYKVREQVIRMKGGKLVRIATIIHELAHHLDNVLNITGVYSKNAGAVPDSLRDELSLMDYEVQFFFEAYANAIETNIGKNRDLKPIKSRVELKQLISDWNDKKGIFKDASIVQAMGEISSKIKTRTEEGFAEYLRLMLTDGLGMKLREDLPPTFGPTNAFIENSIYGAPEFHKWFMGTYLVDNADLARNLMTVRGMVKTWRKGGPVSRAFQSFARSRDVDRKFYTGEKESDRQLSTFMQRAYTAMVDKFHPLKRVSDQVLEHMKELRKDLDKYTKQLKESLTAEEKSHIKSQIAQIEKALTNRQPMNMSWATRSVPRVRFRDGSLVMA